MLRSLGMSEKSIRDSLAENADLKKLHEQLRREVRTILCRHEGTLGRVTSDDSTGGTKRFGGGRTRPNRAGDMGLTGSLRKQWNSLKQLVEILEARAAQSDVTHVISVTDHEKELTRLTKEVEELKEELRQSRELISQQQQLLQDQLVPQPGEGQSSPMWDAYFLEEQLRLQQDRALFAEQKMAFQDEREKFTEAAIRLGRERLQFKADQALFMKQQFLNMTPGLGTPPWKKTPPWSALAADTPAKTSSNSKQQFTPSRSLGRNRRKGLTSADPMTPSTEELYRILRLAPPSRSMMSCRYDSSSSQLDMESEDNSQRWSDSLSPTSESPELQPLPEYVIPFKLSMTPYLRPRPTPVNLPYSNVEPRSPSTAELFRALHLTPAESMPSGKRGYGDELRRSILHHSHRRASLSKAAESPCCTENVTRSKEAAQSPYELARADCEVDSLSPNHDKQTPGEADAPDGEMPFSPIDSSECFDNDSLYKVSPLHNTTHDHYEENVPQLRVDSHYCYQDTDQNLQQCQELDEEKSANRVGPKIIHKSRPKETLHDKNHSKSRSRETLHPQDACRSTSSCRSRSQERLPSRDQCKSRSKEDLYCGSCPCHQAKEALYFEGDCTIRRNEATPHSAFKRRRSLDSLHHKHGFRTQARECHSLHRRSSRQRRDSLYTSGPGRSPLHFHHSCSSAQNGAIYSEVQDMAANLCADMLKQFMDCPF
ncbi:hypothetical protein GDO78_018288 [Eleutherodactylus coqui]|uniref:Uncharacterized protein n=2 Tax=Eleutherodactylus coqui TaxID=57060 RepID=A0A8J6EP54_ELECQ|nr:hypothetical protein GDO78_018288 [Eleutherodactylus coqui]